MDSKIYNGNRKKNLNQNSLGKGRMKLENLYYLTQTSIDLYRGFSRKGNFYPPKDSWQCLETFLVATPGKRRNATSSIP